MKLLSVCGWHGAEPINSVLGDESFVTKYRRSPALSDIESVRIKVHLAFVSDRLRAKNLSSMDVGLLEKRRMLLHALDAYSEEGQFPQNTETLWRTPIFIDSDGTACAVAHLMQKSGYATLAAEVNAEFHRAYIQNICMSTSKVSRDVAEWAKKHGFELEELAEIQPGYSPQDIAKLWFLLLFFLSVLISHLNSLVFGVFASIIQWPCPATVQFIAGGINGLIAGIVFSIAYFRRGTDTFSKRCLSISFVICSVLGLANAFSAMVQVSTPVCKASQVAIVSGWVLLAVPILLVLFALIVLAFVNLCNPKLNRKTKKSRHPQQAFYHGNSGPIQTPYELPLHSPVVQVGALGEYSWPVQPAHAMSMQMYPSGLAHTPITLPMQYPSESMPATLAYNNHFMPQPFSTPPAMFRTLSFSASRAFGFGDPYAKFAMDNVSTHADSDEVSDVLETSDSE